MKIALGFYTTVSSSSESSVLNRALNYVYQPVLSRLYNKGGDSIFLYQSSYMMRYIREHRAEFKTLLSYLSKRGDIDFLTGSYTQSILSLLQPKDRVREIENMTSQIRKDYSYLSDTAFFYGEVWAPHYISAMKTCKIESLVISSYDSFSKRTLYDEPFNMNELGKRVRVYVSSDPVSSLVYSFSIGEIGLSSLYSGIRDAVSSLKSRDAVVFLNIDQIIMGATREGSLEEVPQFLISLLNSFSGKLTRLKDVRVQKNGYLDSGWYSYDSCSFDLFGFNELFARNESFRYLYNRYMSFYDLPIREEKGKKKDIGEVELGPIFSYDAQCTPLLKKSHDDFWSYVINRDQEHSEMLSSYFSRGLNLEDNGSLDYYMSNSIYEAVLSSKGAAIAEFNLKSRGINIFDTRCPYDRTLKSGSLLKSFSNTCYFNGKSYSFDSRIFDIEAVDKKRSEFLTTFKSMDLPFLVNKHIKMKNSTFIVDLTLINISQKRLDGYIAYTVYLSSDGFQILSSDVRNSVEKGILVNSKTVRYTDRSQDIEAIFSSTDFFRLREEDVYQEQFTSSGLERFNLYKKVVFEIPASIEPNKAGIIRLILRVNDLKERKDVH